MLVTGAVGPLYKAVVSPVYEPLERIALGGLAGHPIVLRTPCTYFESDPPDSTGTLSHEDRASIQRIRLNSQNLTLQSNGIAICILGFGIFSLLLTQSSPGEMVISNGPEVGRCNMVQTRSGKNRLDEKTEPL